MGGLEAPAGGKERKAEGFNDEVEDEKEERKDENEEGDSVDGGDRMRYGLIGGKIVSR